MALKNLSIATDPLTDFAQMLRDIRAAASALGISRIHMWVGPSHSLVIEAQDVMAEQYVLNHDPVDEILWELQLSGKLRTGKR